MLTKTALFGGLLVLGSRSNLFILLMMFGEHHTVGAQSSSAKHESLQRSAKLNIPVGAHGI